MKNFKSNKRQRAHMPLQMFVMQATISALHIQHLHAVIKKFVSAMLKI
jgi:hypothetical protein